MGDNQQRSGLAVLTSGGDAPGMNAAVRAVVRGAHHRGVPIHAIHEGYRGMVTGGDLIRPISSADVGGILYQGGTVIGTARSVEFRKRAGRRTAAANLVRRGIDSLVVIGGDGSLTGASLLREEWPALLEELVAEGSVTDGQAAAHGALRVVGLVGSIDNDLFGTDMTIGADTALHRITEAVDGLRSTASSHQRTFVIEVMGRNCGYLALMSGIATGANWVFLPEHPPDDDDWATPMCDALRAGRDIGRRQSLVIVAEGARDRSGEPITADAVRAAIEERLEEDTRITILGHVQRGGSPSAFDRQMSTRLGDAAVEKILAMAPEDEPVLVGIRENQIVTSPLMHCIEQTHEVAARIKQRDYDGAMALRGGSFGSSFDTLRVLTQARPRHPDSGRPLRLAVIHGGGPAPGMNTAVRVAVRLGRDRGHTMLGVRNGFRGLRDGDVDELDWMSVTGWVSRGGAELGTNRFMPDDEALEVMAGQIRAHQIDGLLVIGGYTGYRAAHALHARRDDHPALRLPIVCVPASINNDLPGSELSVGSDTALNAIVSDVDKLKQSAVASRRVFVVEVMGHDCGYLALLGGLSTGAERIYLPEEGITLDQLREDVGALLDGFANGKRLGLVIRSEFAERIYTTDFLRALFEKEGNGVFNVRTCVLGHVQQGGDPSPFDRIQATRLTTRSIEFLVEQANQPEPGSAFIGLERGRVRFTGLARFPELTEDDAQRPRRQTWLGARGLATVMSG